MPVRPALELGERVELQPAAVDHAQPWLDMAVEVLDAHPEGQGGFGAGQRHTRDRTGDNDQASLDEEGPAPEQNRSTAAVGISMGGIGA